jgi:aryl-alcohol dehydrogenase
MYCEQFNALNLQTDPAGRSAKLLTGGNARLKYFGQSSFAHHALASERNAIKIAKDVPLGILGPLGCGIQTGAGTVMNGMRPRPGSSIAILGTGAVGLAALLAARVCECETIIVVDRVESRLKLAQALGATHLINTVAAADLRKAMRDILPRGADYIVDCAGVPSLIGAALGGLGPLGTLGLVAVPPSLGLELSVPWFSLVNGGQRIQGFVEGNSVPEVYIPQLVELYRTGRFPFDKLIKTYPFERINEAVNDQETGQTIKAVLEVREN